MKDQPLKPSMPDLKNSEVKDKEFKKLSDQATQATQTNQADQTNQQGQRAITQDIDKNEIGIWNEISVTPWNEALVDAEFDAQVNDSELGIWNELPKTSLQNTPVDAPVDESEAGIWEQTAIAEIPWQDAPIDEDEEGIWEQTAIAETPWQDAPEKDKEEEKRKEGMVFLPKIVETLSYPLVPMIGYGFLGLSLFDHINIIYPIKIFEPLWITETLGQISERIPIVWIALLLIFTRSEGFVRRWEVMILKLLSWLCLFLGIVYLLMTPMLIGNTVRVYRLVDTQINTRSADQVERVKKAREQIRQTNDQDLSAYLQYRNNQGDSAQSLNAQQFKESLLTQADKNLNEIAINTENARTSQLGDLIKKSVKWSVGNLISTFVCIWIWYSSRWTRIKNLELDSKF